MKYLNLSGLTYFLNKIKTYLTSSTYLDSIGISNSDIDDIADDAGYSSGSLPASEDIFITGDIIPNTDNSVDLGASSKNIKMIYTKGITINGTQFLPSDYIPKAGSNAISGDLVPSTDGTVNLGSPSYQWNNAYIKSLTINGVACGDILTHNASEFVNVSSNQIVAGNKTFTGYVIFNTYRVQIKHSSQEIGVVPSSNQWNGITFTDKNNSSTFSIEQAFFSNGNAMLHISMTPNIAGGSLLRIFESTYNPSTADITTKSRTMIPDANNSRNLGSPSLQWNNAYTRNMLIDNDINIASSTISKTSTSGTLALRSGINPTDGASIGLYAKDYSGALAGCIYMTAYGNSDNTSFRIFPNGTITVYNNSTNTTKNVAMQEDVIPLAGSNQISGSLIPATDNSIDIGSSTKNIKALYTKGITIDGAQFLPSDYIPRRGGAVMTGNMLGRTVNNDELRLQSGATILDGSLIALYGGSRPTSTGAIQLIARINSSNSKNMWWFPDGTWTWTGTACQITSDQRFKQQITQIDDDLLTAWEDVNLVQFKYNDAVKEKSDNARLHTGYVVQQIDEACKKHNVDISEYGLYCHEEYPEETEEVEVEQADGTKVKERKVIREASEHYSLRYTEALIVECAYLRKRIKELEERLEKLEGNTK